MNTVFNGHNFFFHHPTFEKIHVKIFTYIPKNRTVLCFAYTCKKLYCTYRELIKKSTSRFYRLRHLDAFFSDDEGGGEMIYNKKKDRFPEDMSIDLFGVLGMKKNDEEKKPNFLMDNRLFVEDIEEYENSLKHHSFVKILAEVNQKFGEVCMICGGYSLMHLLKTKDFGEYCKELRKLGLNSVKMDMSQCESPGDIDVFILGDRKDEVLNEILRLMKERFDDAENFIVFYSGKFGLMNAMIEEKYSDSVNVPSDLMKKRGKSKEKFYTNENDYKVVNGKLYKAKEDLFFDDQMYYVDFSGGTVVKSEEDNKDLKNFDCCNVFQFIMKKTHRSPSDIFAFFDIDCCKIGYFPGLKLVKVSVSFIRSLCTGVNYCDLDDMNAGYKHFTRMKKYFHRTNIQSSIEVEPLLSYYHDFIGVDGKGRIDYLQQNKRRILYEWGKGFGNVERDNKHKKEKGDYYKGKSEMKIDSFRMSEFQGTKMEVSTGTDLPYMAESVGIVIEDGRYIYRESFDQNKLVKLGKLMKCSY